MDAWGSSVYNLPSGDRIYLDQIGDQLIPSSL